MEVPQKTKTRVAFYTKQSKSERERQIPYDSIYMWNLKYDTNELTYETQIDSQTERTDS